MMTDVERLWAECIEYLDECISQFEEAQRQFKFAEKETLRLKIQMSRN